MEILLDLGIEAVPATGGAEALENLSKSKQKETPFDMLLIDSDMPEVDGFALAEEISNQQISRAAMVMLLTFPHLKRKSELETLGIAASLVKPFGATELENVILGVMGIGETAAELSAQAQKKASQIPSRKLKILVAEDTPFNQKFIQRLLDRWNHQTTIVSDGRQALDALAQDRYDIVLMDVQMPVMDGYTATREIRNLTSDIREIPIVALTAHAIKGDRERCLEAGMNEYVSKPIDSDKLFNAIEKLTASPDKTGASNDASLVLDEELLLEAFDGDWDFLREVVDVFLSDYPGLLDDLHMAHEDSDPERLMRAAHSLKGMLRNFQAEPAAEVAFELEKKGRKAEFEGVPEFIESLSGQVAQLGRKLRILLAQKYSD
jgi:CheY-like chemotaxis protein/HPt (histidine-containing phosphotransfer) domain-containing protein